jgi:raffinose/stachyose/melibiose transport system substrate-binding protein
MGTWYMQYSPVVGAKAAISGAGVAHPKPFPQVPVDFPDVAGTGHVGTLFGDADFGLAVNRRSKHIAAATTFATWLGTSKVGQQEVANVLNDVPALNSALPDWNTVKLVDRSVQQPALQRLIDASKKATEPRLSDVSDDLQIVIGDASTTVALGKATPAQAAAALEKGAVKVRKADSAPGGAG